MKWIVYIVFSLNFSVLSARAGSSAVATAYAVISPDEEIDEPWQKIKPGKKPVYCKSQQVRDASGNQPVPYWILNASGCVIESPLTFHVLRVQQTHQKGRSPPVLFTV